MLILSCLFPLFNGCKALLNSGSSEEFITINLPQWPPSDSPDLQWPELSKWKITIVCSESEKNYFTNSQSIIVKTERNKPFCLLAQPITGEYAFFKPAGFIYPWSYKNLNYASWEEGFLSDIMAKLFRDGIAACISSAETEYLVSTFNWKKAQETIEKKISTSKTEGAETTFYNPWLIDYRNLLENLSAGNFKQPLLNTSGCTTIPISKIQEKITPGNNQQVFPQIFSSFVPENFTTNEKQTLSIRKKTPELFYIGNKRGILVEFKSLKNISLEFINLPIYIEDI